VWHDIISEKDIIAFMEEICYFHDSCVKEMWYLSGSFVEENGFMHPLNDSRTLRVIVQGQFKETSVIEMEFGELKYMRLFPLDCRYTSEILDSTMLQKDGYIYWCDWGDISESALDRYEGTLICAKHLRWRSLDDALGRKPFYNSKTGDT
jgi:hypothetical protein